MEHRITDIWFRFPLPLIEIARRLGVQDVTEGAENYWARVIGKLGEARLDITRTHTRSAAKTDTRIFLVDGGSFPAELLAQIVGRLQHFVQGSIAAGRWQYRSGEDYELVGAQVYDPTR
jgi:hypothetical protein